MSALPGRAPDISVAHTHRIIRIFECQDLPVLTGLTDIGAGPWVTTVVKRRPGRYATWRPSNGPSTAPWPAHTPPVERGAVRLELWRPFRQSHCSANRITIITRTALS